MRGAGERRGGVEGIEAEGCREEAGRRKDEIRESRRESRRVGWAQVIVIEFPPSSFVVVVLSSRSSCVRSVYQR